MPIMNKLHYMELKLTKSAFNTPLEEDIKHFHCTPQMSLTVKETERLFKFLFNSLSLEINRKFHCYARAGFFMSESSPPAHSP